MLRLFVIKKFVIGFIKANFDVHLIPYYYLRNPKIRQIFILEMILFASLQVRRYSSFLLIIV